MPKSSGVQLAGVTVTSVTAFNAAFIRDNNIGPGTIIEIERAGDVIPHITKIVKSTKASLPKDIDKYEWNDTNVDLVLKESLHASSDELKIQKLIQFFTFTKIEYFSEGLIRRFYANGYKTVPDILSMTAKQMIKDIPSFEAKSVTRTITEFAKFTNPGIYLPVLMYASGCFGRGLGADKLQKIYDAYGDECVTGWTNFSLREIENLIDQIPGFTNEFGEQYAKGIKSFIKFRHETVGVGLIKIRKNVVTGSSLKGQIICFTGFRNPELVDIIETNGGKYVNSLSQAVTTLLIKNEGATSEKLKKAKANVQIMTVERFRKLFKV